MTELSILDDGFPPQLEAANKNERDCNHLIDVITRNNKFLEKMLDRSGVVMLRGYNIYTVEQFRSVCVSFRPLLRNYTGGDSPRSTVSDMVYTSTEYEQSLEVLLHNELSYGGWFPDTVFFGCLQASATGGETHVADGRKVYTDLDASIRHRFESVGISYLQYLWDKKGHAGHGKSWQETFETNDRDKVEQHLTDTGVEYEWTAIGLRTMATRPAVQRHQRTGELCWHNQADQWHRKMPSVKDSVSGSTQHYDANTAGVETFGNHVTYADGSEIDPKDLMHIRQVSQNLEVALKWKKGGVMIIDNILAMHGRKPYTGDRKIIVAMA